MHLTTEPNFELIRHSASTANIAETKGMINPHEHSASSANMCDIKDMINPHEQQQQCSAAANCLPASKLLCRLLQPYLSCFVHDKQLLEIYLRADCEQVLAKQIDVGYVNISIELSQGLMNTIIKIIGYDAKLLSNQMFSAQLLCEIIYAGKVHKMIFRFSAIRPPAQSTSILVIRKKEEYLRSLQQLVVDQRLDISVATILSRLLLAQMNIVICGPAGSGKSSLLAALYYQLYLQQVMIRIAVIEEDAGEINLAQKNCVYLKVTQNMDAQSIHEICLRLSITTIIIGEIRNRVQATLWALALMSGYRANACTLHAQDANEVLLNFSNFLETDSARLGVYRKIDAIVTLGHQLLVVLTIDLLVHQAGQVSLRRIYTAKELL